MNKYPQVAIVILNWNGVDFLAKFLPSVLASTYPNLTIYVADNGSTDTSISFLQKNYPTVQIVDNQKNYGFAQGYNEALKHIQSDYYVLLNSDVEVTPNWIEPVIQLMECEEKIVACQPKILSFNQPTHFEHAGAAGGWIDRFGYAFCRGRFFDVCEEDSGQYDNPSQIFWATGAALFFKSEVFHQLGGFDGDFFAHMEEIDLCWRAKRAGYCVMYCPDSVVHHVGGGSLAYGNPRKTYLNFRNNLAMLFKNLSFFQLLTIFPIRLVLDVIATIKALLTNHHQDSKAIVKAQWDFFKALPHWIKKRKATKQTIKKLANKSTFNKAGLYKRSIIVDYFFRGKRSFLEILGK